MSKRPQLIGVIDEPISKDQPLSFHFSDKDQLIKLPPAYIDYKADQFEAKYYNRDQRIQPHKLLAEYGPDIFMTLIATNLDVHLIINSSGGELAAWEKYGKALEQLRSEGSITTAHALNRVQGLAADIYVCANYQTALDDTEFTFDAGDVPEEDMTTMLVKSAEEENIVLTGNMIQYQIKLHQQTAERDWDHIRKFLLSDTNSIHRSSMEQQLNELEKSGNRNLSLTGKELSRHDSYVKTHNSVRSLFAEFSSRTGIPFTKLPPTPIQHAFTVAAIEEQIKKEFGVPATLILEGMGEDRIKIKIASDTPEPIKQHAQRISDIIDQHMYAREFAQKRTQN